MKRIITSLMLALCAIAAAAQPGYQPSDEILKARSDFEAERFGIFIHWGVYSMIGQGEWVMQNQDLNYKEYAHLADGFYPSKFNAEEWVSAIKAAGAKYITITSRHHDGFSMFDSKASDYNIVKATPFGRDVIGELAQACRKEGINLHFYYSHLDWGRTDYPRGRTGLGTGRSEEGQDWRHYMDFVNAQLTELLTQYGRIGAIWFDGLWDQDAHPREDQPALWNLYEQYELIHRLQPGCLVGNNHHLLPFEGEDIQIFERDQPGQNEFGLSGQEISPLPLETCQTMNYSWGYRINDRSYKSSDFLIRYLVETAAKGANLLLNIGPRPDGTLPDEALERLEAMGKWLAVNGESIYGTTAGCLQGQDWGVSTQKDNALYLHMFQAPETLSLDFTDKLLAAEVLGGEKIAFKQKKGKISLTLPSPEEGCVDMVVKLTFKNPVR
ncbi:MAG: alpha-L-fucosidase [Bacteroidales bacterium]|nr:alpha-L-fucosidase [Bacteroidales bacterium]